jgi:hypothetical protein
LRRYAPVVVVQNAEQVNVGNQQLNVNNSDARPQGGWQRVRGKRGACTCLVDRQTLIEKNV